MTPPSDTDLAIPPALAADIQAAALEEHRPPIDILRDAVAGYRRERRWRRTLAQGASHADALGLTQADIPRLIAEYRQEKRQGTPTA